MTTNLVVAFYPAPHRRRQNVDAEICSPFARPNLSTNVYVPLSHVSVYSSCPSLSGHGSPSWDSNHRVVGDGYLVGICLWSVYSSGRCLSLVGTCLYKAFYQSSSRAVQLSNILIRNVKIIAPTNSPSTDDTQMRSTGVTITSSSIMTGELYVNRSRRHIFVD
ncbi:hypothetical protein WN944_015686 [Citrus x changshan-huyou]|uniref:Uncharacterized protein n=1 Tax=Citrus x changshan-huyou TaxID=2935761 RepID=A0AAP0MAN3_9ROSI